VFWDPKHISKDLVLENEEYDPRVVYASTSLHSFKTIYASEPFIQGERYYFEVKFLKGCNFKIGICKNRDQTETAFCDTFDGFGYYSAGQLRNGSKTSGLKYGDSFKGNKD